ncbi:MAG: flagellar assembly protein FliH [Phycisphaerae bacterium]|nr:flagellar assembly protein FliH [Phycisphaerae bacterium]
MLNMVSIILDRPISSAQVCGAEDNQQVKQAAAAQAKAMFDAEMQKIEAEKKRIVQLISAVEAAAIEIDDIRKRTVTENQKQIALLAVEIARKILTSEIEEGRYDIEAMIEKALQASPSRQGAVVRLSPADHATIEKIMKSGNGNFENIKFEADSSILPAQCFVATSKGVVEYFIDDQLNSISETLSSN